MSTSCEKGMKKFHDIKITCSDLFRLLADVCSVPRAALLHISVHIWHIFIHCFKKCSWLWFGRKIDVHCRKVALLWLTRACHKGGLPPSKTAWIPRCYNMLQHFKPWLSIIQQYPFHLLASKTQSLKRSVPCRWCIRDVLPHLGSIVHKIEHFFAGSNCGFCQPCDVAKTMMSLEWNLLSLIMLKLFMEFLPHFSSKF